MFKIGQKVRVKQWLDMSEELQASYSINTSNIGEIGTLVGIPKKVMNIDFYDVAFEDAEYPLGFFEQELEPLVRIGEQLVFAFMQTSD